MDLFVLIKIMFQDQSKWKSVTEYDKSKNFFMINRFISIMYPVQANMVNRNGINSSAIIDMWYIMLTKRFKKIPGWIFTKTASKKEKNKQWIPNPEISEYYIKYNKIKEDDFNFMIKLYPEEMKKKLEILEKQINYNE
jgi:hypothetical protein